MIYKRVFAAVSVKLISKEEGMADVSSGLSSIKYGVTFFEIPFLPIIVRKLKFVGCRGRGSDLSARFVNVNPASKSNIGIATDSYRFRSRVKGRDR